MSSPHRTNPKIEDVAPADPFADWYAAWRAGRDALRAADDSHRAQMRGDVAWLVYVLVGWSVAAAAAGGVALALWSGS